MPRKSLCGLHPDTHSCYSKDNFEELVRKVAQEVDVFVPIVSFKEVPKEDWRRLPNLIKRGASRPPDLIVCTHFDQVGRGDFSTNTTLP
jgi:hypothetical protein